MTVRRYDDAVGNADVEQRVLGMALIDEATMDEAAAALQPADFVLDRHQRIWRAMLGLRESGAPVEQVSVVFELERLGELERVGGVSGVAMLTDGQVSIDPTHYIELVRGYSHRRKLNAYAIRLQQVVLDPEATAEDVAVALELPVDDDRAGRALRSFAEVAGARLDEVLRLSDAEPGEAAGHPTGLANLDHLTTGLRAGELWVIGAVPGAGKTAWMGQVVDACISRGVGVGVFSLEMSGAGLADRLMSLRTGIHLRRFRVPRALTVVDKQLIVDAREGLAALPLTIDDTPGLPLAVLRARARLMQRRQPGLGLVVVDYLQLVHGPGDVRREQVAAVARGLKDLARELGVVVVAASQLARPPKGVEVKAPSMLDLKESGEIEAAADVVLLHRPFVLTHRESDRGSEQIIIAKNRHGVIGSVDVVFDAGHCRFVPGSQRELQA